MLVAGESRASQQYWFVVGLLMLDVRPVTVGGSLPRSHGVNIPLLAYVPGRRDADTLP